MFCSLLRRLNKHREDHRQQPFVDKNILNKPVFDSYTQIKTAQSIDTTGVALF